MTAPMPDVGSNALRIMLVCVVLFLLFTPLAAVLIAAASKGRGRVLAWAFAGSLIAALGCLGVATALNLLVSSKAAVFWLFGSPWLSALGAVAGWKRCLGAERAREAAAKN